MKTACLALGVCLFCSGAASAQPDDYSPPSLRSQSMVQATEIFRNGIGVEVVLRDTNVASLDLPPSELKDAARLGVQAAGWSFNEGSDYVIVVSLASVPQVHEDLDAVRVRVQAGGRSAGTGVEQNFGGGIVAEKIVELPRSGRSVIITTTQHLVRTVAAKLRMAILKDQLQVPDRSMERPGDNNH